MLHPALCLRSDGWSIFPVLLMNRHIAFIYPARFTFLPAFAMAGAASRRFLLHFLIFFVALGLAHHANAQGGFQGLSISATSGTVGTSGTFIVSFSGTVNATQTPDAVSFVKIVDGGTVLGQTQYNVGYNKLGDPVNTTQTLVLSAALVPGTHQVYLEADTINASFNSQTFTVTVRATDGTLPGTTPDNPTPPVSTTPVTTTPDPGSAAFQDVVISPTAGTAGSNGTLAIALSGTVAARQTDDAVSAVRIHDGAAVLATLTFNVGYNKLGIPVNTRQTIYNNLAVAPGVHQFYLEALTVNDGFNSATYTVTVKDASGNLPGVVNVSALMAAINILLDDSADDVVVPPVPSTIALGSTSAGSTIAPGSLAVFTVVTGGPAPSMVQLFANGELIGNAQGGGTTWAFNWMAGVANTYTVIARSFNANGAVTAESAPVTIAVGGNRVSMPALPMVYPPVFKSVTREVSFEYYPATGLLYKKHAEPNRTQNRVDTEYAYDGFGNPSTTTTSSPATGTAAIAPRAETPGYDTAGRFPTSHQNALGQTETRVFGADFGQVTSMLDINQNAASAQYDVFGRKTLDVHADGTQLKTDYSYCSGTNNGTESCPAYAAYVVRTTPLGVSGNAIGPVTNVYYNALDREVKTETTGFDGASVISVSTEYTALRQVLRKSRPYYANQMPQWITTHYDSLGRIHDTVQPDKATVTYEYDGLTTKTTNSLNQVHKEERDDLGRVVTLIDNANKSMSFIYDGFGDLLRTTDSVGTIVHLVYDVRGNKIQMFDPDMGIWNYGYDVLGNLTRRADSQLQIASLGYDLVNRMTSRSEPDMIANWTYDTCTKGVGQLCSATADNGYARKIDHDTHGRETRTQTTIDVPYTASVSYNAETGRVATQTYPSGLSITYGYTSLGYLNDVHNTSTLATYWTANAMDAENHLLQATYGNSIVINKVFDAATGFVRTIQAGPNNSVQNLSFDYNTVGNVTFRSDGNQNLSENFYYDDGVNRLTTSALTSSGAGTLQQTYSYYDNGNIKTRSTLGTYHYGAVNAQPHALTSVELSAGGTINYGYDPNGNLSAEVYRDASGTVIATKGRTEAYTSFNMPLKLAAPGGIALNYVYGPEHQRSKLTSNTGTIIYLNPNQEGGLLYEKETKGNTVEHRNFITANGEVIALVKQVDSATKTSYLHRDNLGSTTAVTNEAGAVVEQLAYEPFGKRRFPTGSSDADNAIVGVTTARGFTDHEHLELLGLIHMNGRVFDPVLGRFMSADPNVPEPLDMQSYNRYSYVRNNPLTYVDMTGFWDDGARDAMVRTIQREDPMSTGVKDGQSSLPSIAQTTKNNAAGDGRTQKQVDAGATQNTPGTNNGYADAKAGGAADGRWIPEFGQRLKNLVLGGMFKTNAQMDAWGKGFLAAQENGDGAQYLRDQGMPGGWMKDAAFVGTGGLRSAATVAMLERATLLNELRTNGVKFSAESIVDVRRLEDGRIVFLETGNSKAGLQHIMEAHGEDFARAGISEKNVPATVMDALSQGKIVARQGRDGGRPVYELAGGQRVAITVSNNGFVVGANPAGKR